MIRRQVDVFNATHQELTQIFEERNWIHETDEIGLDDSDSESEETESPLDENSSSTNLVVKQLEEKVKALEDENKKLRRKLKKRRKKRRSAKSKVVSDIKDICVDFNA